MPFLGRSRELAWLEEGWLSGHAEFRVLYGRRGVGISALVDQFAADTRCVTLRAGEGSIEAHLHALTQAILACQDDPVLRAAPLPTWDAALAYLARMAARAPLLAIFDEYQHLVQAEPALPGLLQRWWSRHAMQLPLYLILGGSDVPFFVQHVLPQPAYARNTGVLRVQPLDYREAALFLPGWSPDDRVRAYAIVGGMPSYLRQFEPVQSLYWNVQHKVLARGAVLHQEAERLIGAELPEPTVAFAILRAISGGATRPNRIADRVKGGVTVDAVSACLAALQEVGLVEQRRPVVGDGGRRGVWTIADPYLRFWLRFVLPNLGQVEQGVRVARVYETAIAPALDRFVATSTAEEICRAWVLGRADLGAWSGVDRVGAWWGPMPDARIGPSRRQSEATIGVVAAAGSRVVVVGDARWTTEPVGVGALDRLRRVLPHVPGVDARTELVLFGRTFEPRLLDVAERERVTLVSVDDLHA